MEFKKIGITWESLSWALHVDMGRTSTDVGWEKLRTLASPPGASLGPAPFFFPKEPLPRAGAIGNLDRAKAARHHRPAPHKQPGLPSQVDALPCTFMLQARDFCWCELGADSDQQQLATTFYYSSLQMCSQTMGVIIMNPEHESKSEQAQCHCQVYTKSE